MARTQSAHPSPTQDFWPADSLSAWQTDPRRSFESWLAEYRVAVRTIRISSVTTYKSMFETWLKFLEARNLHLLEARAADGTAFFVERCKVFETREDLTPVSRRRYLLLLDKVYSYLKTLGWANTSPVLDELRKEGELEVPLPPGLGQADQEKLIVVLDALPGWKGARDRAMAALLVGAGLRTHEVVGLQTGQLNSHFSIEVRPGAGRVHLPHRTIVLPEGPWRGWLSAWEQLRAESQTPGDVLCPATQHGKPFSASGLFRRISHWFDLAGVCAEQSGANILRNTFARNALACGRYEEAEVQAFMGHQEARATARYRT